MDTSIEYCNMCKEAGEIYNLWKPERGDYVFHGVDGVLLFDSAWGGEISDKDDGYHWIKDFEWVKKYCVWLPRQDQLQDMISELDNSGFYSQLDQLKHLLDISIQEIGFGLTYEKLWLKVLMRKYDKFWTNGEWKKEQV